MASRAEEYRRLADECLQLANLLPAGERQNVIAMAQTWQRLAEEQDRATDLRQEQRQVQQQQQVQPDNEDKKD
jgi:phytoene/squalene synthetase